MGIYTDATHQISLSLLPKGKTAGKYNSKAQEFTTCMYLPFSVNHEPMLYANFIDSNYNKARGFIFLHVLITLKGNCFSPKTAKDCIIRSVLQNFEYFLI